jgi:hypothetical protein
MDPRDHRIILSLKYFADQRTVTSYNFINDPAGLTSKINDWLVENY